MIVTKDLANKVLQYIYPLGETLSYIAWAIRPSYHRTIQATPGQVVFGRYMVFNLASVIYWWVITAGKHQQVEIENVQENARWVTHDYKVGNLVYSEITGIYCKLYNKKKGPYRIIEVFTNGTFLFQRVPVNEHINIRWLRPHFIDKSEWCPLGTLKIWQIWREIPEVILYHVSSSSFLSIFFWKIFFFLPYLFFDSARK